MNFLHKNTNIHFTSTGKGAAIVLLHGFLENSSMWNKIVEILSIKNRIICVDLLGHGKTENHGYIHTMSEQAIMVKAILKHLRLRKCILIGHSMGGYIALEFSKLFPKSVKGLCLMNSSALPDSKEKIKHRNRAIHVVKQNHKIFIRIAIPLLFSEENRLVFTTEIEQITKEALSISPQGITASLEGMKIRKDLTSIYQHSNFPIQMVIGKQDPALEYAKLIEQIKNTNVQIVPFPDGHMSHIENKDALIKAFLSFIKICK